MKEITVWLCKDHGEFELVDMKGRTAYCPQCGKEATAVGRYTE